MATAAATEMIVHYSDIPEFDVPNYQTNAVQSRQKEKLSHRQV